MKWVKRLLGHRGSGPKPSPDEDQQERDRARKRKQQILEKLVVLGIEADDIIEREKWRREH
jgi:hypothetical protein